MQSTGTSEVREETQTPVAEHLLLLPGNEWGFWRCAALRGAGFPSTEVLKLTAPECANAADRLLLAETEAHQLQQQAIDSLRQRLNAMTGQDEADRAFKSSLSKAIKKLTRAELPPAPAIPCADDSLTAYEAAHRNIESARSDYEQTFNNDLLTLSRNIKQVAAENRFREAVTWQNRHALRRAIDALLRLPDNVRHAERRATEELIAKYVQRYAVKNDTIGFFGPVGWASLDEGEESLRVKAGRALVARRNVYFENWCMQALVARFNGEQSLRPWMSPRRLPSVRLEGMTLYHPLTGTRKLSLEQAILLRSCDGTRNAKELAQYLIRAHSAQFRNEALVYGLLQSLRDKALIFWGFEVPFELFPERALRRQLEKIDLPSLRQGALAPLDELELARERIRSAAGDSERLDAAFANFETTFSRLTHEAPTRSAGKIYAARTLVYEDCRRDTEVVLGRQVLRHLAPPLELLLSSCRWLTGEMARIYRKAFKQLYEQMVLQTGRKQVDALSFWLQAHPLAFSDRENVIADIIADFQSRWAKVLSLPLNERQVHYRTEELRPRVLVAFSAPGPGWAFARHHSPDVMIAADSVEAIERGDFHFVMGELHVGTNTLSASTFCSQHPAPGELLRCFESDLPETKAVPMPLMEWLTSRTNIALVSSHDYRIELERESVAQDRTKSLAIADLVIEEHGGELMVRTRDGRLSFEIIEVFGGLLSGLVVDLFKLFPHEPHTPRVTIARLTIARETWNFSAERLQWALVKEERDRFLAARRWAREAHLPLRMFVKVPVEDKPFYLDLDSPVYVNVLARMVRRTLESDKKPATVKLVEMLPEVEQSWLPDSAGNRYTSELRIVCCDLKQSPHSTH